MHSQDPGNPDALDPLSILPRAATKLKTAWMKRSYPFAAFGRGVSVHYSCDVSRHNARFISIGDNVYMAPGVWLNIVAGNVRGGSQIVVGSGCKIGRRSVISSANCIELEADVLLAPSVLIMDHNHAYADPNAPIHAQGISEGGRITIGANCWLGYGSVIS